MPRSAVVVRDATIQDVPMLSDVWGHIRDHNSRHGMLVPPPPPSRLVEVLESIGYDQVFAAAYSPRPGTPATRLADDVPAAVKRERLN